MAFGTLTLADLQETQNASTIATVGEDRTFEAIQNTLAEHNAIMREMYGELIVRTTEESERYGGNDTMVMEDMDEQAVPRAQKVTAGSVVGYPLNGKGIGLQWTEAYFRKHTVAELAAQVDAMMDADVRTITLEIKKSFLYTANYTHTDHWARNIDLGVKRLLNADSAPIPPGPFGTTFTASTHTHYLATASLVAANLDSLVSTVREHGTTGEIQVWIAQADEAAVRAITGFVAYPDPRLVFADNTVRTQGRTLNVANQYNRAIGILSSNGAEVWVKPYGVPSYPIAINTMAEKPLVWRWDPDYGDGLQLVYDNPSYPLRARAYRRIFGIGVKNRHTMAVLYTGSGTYANPTLVA